MICNKPELIGSRLGHGMHRHTIHPWQKIRPKGLQVVPELNLLVDLRLDKFGLSLRLKWLKRVVKGKRPFPEMSIRKGPETLPEALANRFDKLRILVIN